MALDKNLLYWNKNHSLKQQNSFILLMKNFILERKFRFLLHKWKIQNAKNSQGFKKYFIKSMKILLWIKD